MNYGFVIDNRRCIGCHACTVACKAEHEVPLGNFRTWVKYVEKGTFPDVRRYFTVLRCNHCREAPCVNICPTRALFHRSDGIVDFDNRHCIGCKSCMAACPYDAIYIDPQADTAAKCNYCAHKIEIGLEPACVTVCPEQAIIAGNIDDTTTAISGLIAGNPVSVRKPEKKTQPKLYYVDGDPISLTPGAAPKPNTYVWAERPPHEVAEDFGTRLDPGAARTTFDIPHERPWGLFVSLYLWTKSLAAGPILISALLVLLGYSRAPVLFGRVTPVLSLSFLSVTTVLLIADLHRPERFLKILFHPNRRSWLVWGAYILMVFFGSTLLWFISGVLGIDIGESGLLWICLPFSVLAAGYSAFLLAQARARDLWQSPFLFVHLVVQAALAGSALLSFASGLLRLGTAVNDLLVRCMLAALCVHGFLILIEIAMPKRHRDARDAVQYMVRGPLATLFWLGAVFTGIALPIYVLAFHLMQPDPGVLIPGAASIMSLVGLLLYEHCFICAGQALPQS